MKYYIDCEFDGHNGPLLSFAIVREDGESLYIIVGYKLSDISDPWVVDNVCTVLREDKCTNLAWGVSKNSVGRYLRDFIENDENPVIIADSPVDIGRFCNAISTGYDGKWYPSDYDKITFEVHNVDCYPTTLEGAVQHNAWWDAMALQHKLN